MKSFRKHCLIFTVWLISASTLKAQHTAESITQKHIKDEAPWFTEPWAVALIILIILVFAFTLLKKANQFPINKEKEEDSIP